jgi:hypothetical protein
LKSLTVDNFDKLLVKISSASSSKSLSPFSIVPVASTSTSVAVYDVAGVVDEHVSPDLFG